MTRAAEVPARPSTRAAVRWVAVAALAAGLLDLAGPWSAAGPPPAAESSFGGATDPLAGPFAAALAQPEQPTLPPVIVRPPEDPTAPPSDAPADLAPPADAAFDGAWDVSQSYPALREQAYGGQGGLTGLNGATRGGISLFDAPQFGTITSRGDLDERTPQDMAQTLRTEVGILMQQTARGQASPFIRGLTGQQVLILIDGVRLNNATLRAGPNQYFNLIDPGQVERIEVLRGPASVAWGSDAIGGAINVVTRGADRTRGDYGGLGFTEYFSTADLGSYSRGNVEGSLSGAGVFAGGSYLDVHDLDRGGGLGRQPFTNYHQGAADLKYTYLVDRETLLTVALSHFEQHDLPRSDRFLPFVQGTPPNPAILPRPTFFDPQQRDLAYARLERFADAWWCDAYSATVSYQRNKEGTLEQRIAANPAQTRVDVAEFDVDTVGATLTLGRDLDWAGRLSYGGDYYFDTVDAFRHRFNPNLPNPPAVPQTPQFPGDSRYERAGVYALWDVWLTERLAATTGLRYEHADTQATPRLNNADTFIDRNYQDWVASLGLVYQLDPALHVIGSFSEGYRAPTLDDLFADVTFLQNQQAVPSVNVEPEHAYNYELGLKLDLSRVRGQLVHFWTEIDDYITRLPVDAAGNFSPASSNFIRINSDAYLYGTELAGEWLLDPQWSLYGNFWYVYGQDRGLSEPLSRIPPAQGILGLRWRDAARRNWLDVYTWLVRRQDRYALVNTRDARFPAGGQPGYATLNLRLGSMLDRAGRHRVSVNLENLTDRYYRVLGSGVDGAGINATLGYELRH